MTATYTFDVLCTRDGFGSYGEAGDWGRDRSRRCR